ELCAVTRCDAQRASTRTSHDKPNLRSSTFSLSSRWSKASSAASRRGLIITRTAKRRQASHSWLPIITINALYNADCRDQSPFRRQFPSGRQSGQSFFSGDPNANLGPQFFIGRKG